MNSPIIITPTSSLSSSSFSASLSSSSAPSTPIQGNPHNHGGNKNVSGVGTASSSSVHSGSAHAAPTPSAPSGKVVQIPPKLNNSKKSELLSAAPIPLDLDSSSEELFTQYENFNFWNYIKLELLGMNEADQEVDVKAIESVANFVAVPLIVEQVLLYGVLVCLDSFLFMFAYLPVRFISAVVRLILELIFNPLVISELQLVNGRFFHTSHGFDIMRGIILAFGCVCLHFVNMGALYHFIRGQTMVKLYVLTGMLEVFDKLFGSFGKDAFASLYSTARTKKSIGTLLFYFVVAAAYVVVHSGIFFVHIATLTVAINSSDQALTTVFVLNNFAEIKSYVFKKFDYYSLHDLVCMDIRERFQLFLFIVLITIVSLAQTDSQSLFDVLKSHLFTATIMWTGETIADWIKHAFVIKANVNLDEQMYFRIAGDIRKNVLACAHDKVKGIVRKSSDLSSTIGLSQVLDYSTSLQIV
jgi:hypothetical protein